MNTPLKDVRKAGSSLGRGLFREGRASARFPAGAHLVKLRPTSRPTSEAGEAAAREARKRGRGVGENKEGLSSQSREGLLGP